MIIQEENVEMRTRKMNPTIFMDKFEKNEREIKLIRRSIQEIYDLKRFKLNRKDLIEYNMKRRKKTKQKVGMSPSVKTNEEQPENKILKETLELSDGEIEDLCNVKGLYT